MVIVIRNKKHTFNTDVVSKLSEKEFKEHCLTLKIFTQLPKKERDVKIKEAYGNLTTNAKESRSTGKNRTRSGVRGDDAEQLGRDRGAEQVANAGRKDVKGKKDNTKVRKQELSEKDEK